MRKIHASFLEEIAATAGIRFTPSRILVDCSYPLGYISGQAFSLACPRSSGLWQLRIPSDASGIYIDIWSSKLESKNHEGFPNHPCFFFLNLGNSIRNLKQKKHTHFLKKGRTLS